MISCCRALSAPWNSISFNFYSDIPATTPAAPGTAFLLSMAYAGTPAALSNATPGFIASSTSNAGGIYTFDSAVTLQQNTQYWIFANAALRMSGSITSGTSAESQYTGVPFVNFPSQVLNFTLSGGVVATPEPSTGALIGAAFCGLAFSHVEPAAHGCKILAPQPARVDAESITWTLTR